MTVFVCAEDKTYEFSDVRRAVEAAIALASRHARVGIGVHEADARRVAARALPGMVCCPRADAFDCVDCFPLTATTALVRS